MSQGEQLFFRFRIFFFFGFYPSHSVLFHFLLLHYIIILCTAIIPLFVTRPTLHAYNILQYTVVDCNSNRCYIMCAPVITRWDFLVNVSAHIHTHVTHKHVHLGPRKTPLARLVWHAQCKRRKIAAAPLPSPPLRCGHGFKLFWSFFSVKQSQHSPYAEYHLSIIFRPTWTPARSYTGLSSGDFPCKPQ